MKKNDRKLAEATAALDELYRYHDLRSGKADNHVLTQLKRIEAAIKPVVGPKPPMTFEEWSQVNRRMSYNRDVGTVESYGGKNLHQICEELKAEGHDPAETHICVEEYYDDTPTISFYTREYETDDTYRKRYDRYYKAAKARYDKKVAKTK